MSDIITTDQINSIGSSLVDWWSSLINLIIQLLPFIIAFTVILIIYFIVSKKFSSLNLWSNWFHRKNLSRTHNLKSSKEMLHEMNLMAKEDPELTRWVYWFAYNYRLRWEDVVASKGPFGDDTLVTDYLTWDKYIWSVYSRMRRFYMDSNSIKSTKEYYKSLYGKKK